MPSGGADVDQEHPIRKSGWRRLRSVRGWRVLLIQMLRSRGDVLEVEPNYIVEAEAIPNDPLFAKLVGFEECRAGGCGYSRNCGMGQLTTGSVSNVIAVVDTGSTTRIPTWLPNMWSAPTAFTVTVGGESITCPAGSPTASTQLPLRAIPDDDYSRDTHVAGTIGAVGNNALGVVGVNWTTRIMALKFLDSTGIRK